MRIFFFLLIALAACSPKSPSRAQPAAPISMNRPLLFPPGVYIHKVAIVDPEGKKRKFEGILKLDAEQITVVGLSPFNTTLFKIIEDRKTKTVSHEFYFSAPPTLEIHFLRIYSAIKNAFTLPMKAKKGSIMREGVEVRMRDFDSNGIPVLMEITEKNFSATVTLKEYQAQ